MNIVKRIAIHGVCGRMGQRVLHLLRDDPECQLVGALESPNHPALGQDVGVASGLGPIGVPITDSLARIELLDCVIDFSVPEAALQLTRECAERQRAVLVCTTGFSPPQRDEIISCHHLCPMILAANTSLVVNVLMKLAAMAGSVLQGRDFDVEIIERHHRFKADAPSGTALKLAEILEESMNLTDRVYGRVGQTGQRKRTEIGVHALRCGDNVGEHTIVFSTLGETLELVHKGSSRDSYALGAIAAAKWLAEQKPGMYSMADVLGIA